MGGLTVGGLTVRRHSFPSWSKRWALIAAAAVALSGFAAHAEPWGLWQTYAAAFISPEGRVVDPQGGNRTTSEGQSYALFFSLVANDRARFDKVLNWTRDNLAQGDLAERLPGWEWGRNQSGEWKLLDPHTAADSDLWISYSLIEAGRLWSAPGYALLGKKMAARIAQEEVVNLPGFGPMLLGGDAGFHPRPDTWVTNPSYLPLPVIARMAGADASGPWAEMARGVPRVVQQSARGGFAMDWVAYSQQTGFQPTGAPDASGQFRSPSQGSYDAIRVYLWAGMTSPATAGSTALLGSIGGMASYLNGHADPPEKISGDGRVVGTASPPGFSAALIPYLDALGKQAAAARQQERLDASADPATKLFGHPAAYYDQNLVMFALGWKSRRFHFAENGELRVRWKN